MIPNAIRIVRGHATLDKLALEAFDVGADRILVIRNWKGNPRFLDMYEVVDPKRFYRICTLILKGFKLARECGNPLPSTKPRNLVLKTRVATSMDIQLEIVECLIRGLHAQVRDDLGPNDVELCIEEKRGFYEISFSANNQRVGPVLRVWRAKLFPIQHS